MALIEVQCNLVDGEYYTKATVDDGLFVCPQCFHAYKGANCKCGAARPDMIDLANQWADVRMFDTNTGKVL